MHEFRRPLTGYRVIDLSTMIAGPFCASILGEFGAEVIKVEEPGKGDPFRRFGTMSEAGATFNFLNESRNKKSVTLDLRQPKGVELAKQLVALSDIVVENFRPGTLEKWGLGYDTLKAIKPDILLVRISAYGQSGPYRHKPGYARIAHAFSGLSFLSGETDGPPVVPGSTSLGDYIAGLNSAIGALMALIGRDRYGIGQIIDVSLYEGIFRMLDELAPVYAKHGIVRERMGTDTVNAVPHSHYQTRDGRWIALACSTDKMFARLAAVMERPDLLKPGSYGQIDARVEHRAEVNQIVADWMHALDCKEVLSRCEAGDVPVGVINSIADIFADPHVRERGTLVSKNHPNAGEVVLPNVVARLSETPGSIDSFGPALGEHNKATYRDLLGISEDEIRLLSEAGVI